jgi:hypothetical protein
VIRRADAVFRNEANAERWRLRIDSPGLGDLEQPLIIKTFGDVPDYFVCAAA